MNGLAGIILAAGASRRMGTAKALLLYRDETFLDGLILAFSSYCDSLLVVLGYQPESILTGLRHQQKATFVTNHRHESGQLSSLQCGLREVPPDAAGVLFTPVDYPAIRMETVAALSRAFVDHSHANAAIIPRYLGRRGHPVCVTRQLIQELLALPETAQARDVIRSHQNRTLYVDVDDPGVVCDVDTPQAYADLQRMLP